MFGMFAPWLQAETNQTIEEALVHCLSEVNQQKRLECYDMLAQTLVTDPEDQKGLWQTETQISPLSNSLNINLLLEAQAPVKSRTQTVKPRLELRCENGTSKVYLHWDVYLGKNRTNMLTRFGQQPAQTQRWNITESKRSVYYNDNSGEMVKMIKQQPTMLAQIKPHNGDPITVTFNTKGFARAIASISLSCDW